MYAIKIKEEVKKDMKVKEFIERIKQYEDCEMMFNIYCEGIHEEGNPYSDMPYYERLKNIEIEDISHSEKVIIFGFNDNVTMINSNNCNFKNKEAPIEDIADLELTSQLCEVICDHLIKKDKCQGGNCDNCINKQAEEILKL